MKTTFLLIVLSLTLSNLAFCQNILFLKNGDKMNGKLEGYKNDTIIFKIQGNKLKFKTSEIASVYFDASIAPKDFSKSLTTNEIKTVQDVRLFGVVTYFFNDNYGNKPDVGAEVFVADSVKNPQFDFPKYLRKKLLSYPSALDESDFTNSLKEIVKTVVDGNGSYYFTVKAGTYYVLIKSNHRSGKIECKKVIVREGRDTNLSNNFGLRD